MLAAQPTYSPRSVGLGSHPHTRYGSELATGRTFDERWGQLREWRERYSTPPPNTTRRYRTDGVSPVSSVERSPGGYSSSDSIPSPRTNTPTPEPFRRRLQMNAVSSVAAMGPSPNPVLYQRTEPTRESSRPATPPVRTPRTQNLPHSTPQLSMHSKISDYLSSTSRRLDLSSLTRDHTVDPLDRRALNSPRSATKGEEVNPQQASISDEWDRWWADVTARRNAAEQQQQQQQHQYETIVAQPAPLPHDWQEATDPSTGKKFYYNILTRISQWERPPPSSVGSPRRDVLSGGGRVSTSSVSQTSVTANYSHSPARKRSPSMDWSSTTDALVPPLSACDQGKYTIVLDLDETLVYARAGPLSIRQGCRELLQMLRASDRCETIVWTAGERCYAQAVLEELDPECTIVQHCVYRHNKWFTGQVGQAKDLKKLGRNLDQTIIIENTPDCVRKNVNNAVLVPDYHGSPADDALLSITVLLRLLLSSGKSVPQFLQTSPLVTLNSVRTDVGDNVVVYGVGDLSVVQRSVNFDMNDTRHSPRGGFASLS